MSRPDESPAASQHDREQALADLERAIAASHASLDKIGEGDWTPQDQCHAELLLAIELVDLLGLIGGDPGAI